MIIRPRHLAMSTGGGLKRHFRETRDFGKVASEAVKHFEHALNVCLVLVRVQVGESRHRGHALVDPRVVLHCATAEGIKVAVDTEAALREGACSGAPHRARRFGGAGGASSAMSSTGRWSAGLVRGTSESGKRSGGETRAHSARTTAEVGPESPGAWVWDSRVSTVFSCFLSATSGVIVSVFVPRVTTHALSTGAIGGQGQVVRHIPIPFRNQFVVRRRLPDERKARQRPSATSRPNDIRFRIRGHRQCESPDRSYLHRGQIGGFERDARQPRDVSVSPDQSRTQRGPHPT